MTNDYLINELIHISGKRAVLKLIEDINFDPKVVKQIYALTSHDNTKVQWRAAWVFEHIYFVNPESYKHYLPDMVKRLPHEKSDGIKRHFSKMISFSKVNNIIDGDFINTCFDWLISEKIPVAVKAHCMQILYNVCEDYPDLKSELIQVIESQIDNNSVGFKSRGKKIISALQMQ